MLNLEQIWRALETVADPEIPVVSICELGIVREVRVDDACTTVTITPTYSGCPANEAIERAIRETLEQAGAARVRVERSLSPAWTSDWITPTAAEKLRAYGIAPPGAPKTDSQPVRFVERAPACPRCGGKRTQRLSEFGSTACKALYRCADCAEPFDYFKPI
jgi:ring-1,2-phenylacetyl-CoA epoxidase subunit PaaD